MNKKLFLLLCVMALVVVLGVLTLRLSKLYVPPAVRPPPALDVPSVMEPGHLQYSGSGSPVSDVPATEKKTLSQHAVESWEKQIADVIERTDVPVNEQSKRVKEAFDKLDIKDQMDGIHHGLNLLPDDRFAVLYDILYDKSEDSEVLDAIFSDALNRSEEIKMPLMKALRKDREHPMFFESARILDVVESEGEKAQQE